HTRGPNPRVEIVGAEFVETLRDDGVPGIFFSAHLANWEVACIAAAEFGLPLGQIYRSADNPWIDWLFRRMRSSIAGERIPKGREGARQLVRTMRDGGHLAIMADQKLNEGLPVPFFGRDAMTPTAPASLALRFRCPLVPTRVERLPGVRFRITFFPPLAFSDTGDADRDVRLMLTEMNRTIEGWVREHPEQWFWVHRRWPDS